MDDPTPDLAELVALLTHVPSHNTKSGRSSAAGRRSASSSAALDRKAAESVPSVGRLMAVVREIDAVSAEYRELCRVVADDVGFMEVPTVELTDLRNAEEARLGTVFHLHAYESESTGTTRLRGHAAAECAAANRHVADCDAPVGARVKRKWNRVGRRNWNTSLGDHVLINVQDGDEPVFTLAPLSQRGATSRKRVLS